MAASGRRWMTRGCGMTGGIIDSRHFRNLPPRRLLGVSGWLLMRRPVRRRLVLRGGTWWWWMRSVVWGQLLEVVAVGRLLEVVAVGRLLVVVVVEGAGLRRRRLAGGSGVVGSASLRCGVWRRGSVGLRRACVVMEGSAGFWLGGVVRRRLSGASGRRRSGASGRKRSDASKRRSGASEKRRSGAREKRRCGASERRRSGASERRSGFARLRDVGVVRLRGGIAVRMGVGARWCPGMPLRVSVVVWSGSAVTRRRRSAVVVMGVGSTAAEVGAVVRVPVLVWGCSRVVGQVVAACCRLVVVVAVWVSRWPLLVRGVVGQVMGLMMRRP